MNPADANDVRTVEYAITEKPWGREQLIVVTEKYAFKRIHMKKGVRSSLQAHERKLETIYVVSGRIELELIDDNGVSTTCMYRPDESYTLLPGIKHRVSALDDTLMDEVSTPQLDDVIRFEDDFGRKS